MDNPHPLWACYGCHRQWQWRARPLGCGFCSCTYIVPVSENAVALVAFEREAADLARGGLGKIIRRRRADPPKPHLLVRCSICRGPHHNRLACPQREAVARGAEERG